MCILYDIEASSEMKLLRRRTKWPRANTKSRVHLRHVQPQPAHVFLWLLQLKLIWTSLWANHCNRKSNTFLEVNKLVNYIISNRHSDQAHLFYFSFCSCCVYNSPLIMCSRLLIGRYRHPWLSQFPISILQSLRHRSHFTITNHTSINFNNLKELRAMN